MVSESCGNPSVEVEATMSRRPKYDKSKICIKCKVNNGAIVVRHAVYCKECFPALLSSKVKRILEPHINPKPESSRKKSLKASGNLLVGFSGGLGSTTLLDLISRIYLSNRMEIKEEGVAKLRGGKGHPRNEPVWEKVTVCYVEIAAGFSGMTDRTETIQQLVQENFEALDFIPLRIENAFDPAWWDRVGGKLTSDMNADLINDGTSLTSLSINLISSIAQGGGFSVREEAQEEWKSDSMETVRLIRPLQEITMKECSMWAWWNNLRVLGKQRHPGVKQGIGALTKDFIVGLERDYPSTVSTIARTCAKLAPRVGALGSCILCERPLQPGVQEWIRLPCCNR
ncbi:cytoplasmic trna 2-thiolation protein 2 [Lentinula edodes]|uniref:Cytoplasmic trna 2-thiolation protein 2 n=1 Tax=Lentinula edodes TaxID=5353 RepID=A0A1Q3E331_LENED|nr:cytoplasmic trna 2-thiolation protein 2 [Lentinula edodes]